MLTARAASKLQLLRDAEDDTYQLLAGVKRRLGEVEHAINYAPNSPDVPNLEHEATRLRGRLSDLQDRHRHLANLNGMIRDWTTRIIADKRQTEDVKLPRAKLEKGETHRDAVARIRTEIASVLKERLDVQQAGLPKQEMKAQLTKWVAEQARKGRPRLVASHEKFEVQFDDGRAFTPGGDWGAVLCWLCGEGLIEELEAIIDALPEPALALLPAERSERLAAIKARLVELERLEEAYIDAAESEGQQIQRRPNADPAAILGVVIVKKREAAA